MLQCRSYLTLVPLLEVRDFVLQVDQVRDLLVGCVEPGALCPESLVELLDLLLADGLTRSRPPSLLGLLLVAYLACLILWNGIFSSLC